VECRKVTLLDTHVLLWLAVGDKQIGRDSLISINRALAEDLLYVSAISFWEVAMLVAKKRIQMDWTPSEFRSHSLGLGIRELAVDGHIGVLSVQLTGLPADPADRIIVASTVVNDATLITADDKILLSSATFRRKHVES
jgi:PIN domain nuclease of toxin-antitoxin system